MTLLYLSGNACKLGVSFFEYACDLLKETTSFKRSLIYQRENSFYSLKCFLRLATEISCKPESSTKHEFAVNKHMYLTFHLTFPLFQSLQARYELIHFFLENSSSFYLEKTFTSLAIELKLVFKWESKETVVCFSSGIYLISLSDWSTKLAPLSQRVRSKTKTNHHLNASIFPRLGIGSKHCLRLLWLVRVIDLVVLPLWSAGTLRRGQAISHDCIQECFPLP